MAHSDDGIGAPAERREDPALLLGSAKFTDDFSEQRMLHAAVVRSQVGHAVLNDIDTTRATALEGVSQVYTAEDIEGSGIAGRCHVTGLLPINPDAPGKTTPADIFIPEVPLLARDKVVYQGQAIAVVVAEDRYTAHEACDLVRVDYDRLDATVDPVDAVQDGAPTLYNEGPSNVAFDWNIGDADEVDRTLERADHTVDIDLVHPRVIGDPIEPRATIASYDEGSDKLVVRLSTQSPHHERMHLSKTLEHPENKIRVIAPHVGGGFGPKIYPYPDEALTAWCAMQLGRPVKHQQTRSETHLADTHGRGHVTHAEMALDKSGQIQGVKVETYANIGAYVSSHAPLIPTNAYGRMLPGPFDIPELSCRVVGALTNTAPVDAYRGAGQPEAAYVIQRLLHKAANDIGIDASDILRQNYIDKDEFPFETVTGLTYDSGNYEAALEKALDIVDYDEFRERQTAARAEGNLLGIGLASFVEMTGLAPCRPGVPGPLPGYQESSIIRFHPDGSLTACMGTSDHGQGHGTVFTQILSDELGVAPDDIDIVTNDTDGIPQGTGTFASRSAVVGGNSLVKSSDKIKEKARLIAAHQLEVAPSDLQFDDGTFSVEGAPDRAIHLQEVAKQAHLAHDLPKDVEPGLETTTFYDPDGITFAFGTHVAVVEVDEASGEIDLVRYVAVDDCGHKLNPKIVEGQVQGGIAQGLGSALFEEAIYSEVGNLVTASLQDYTLPKSVHLPDFEIDFTVTPATTNPLGIKGVGEAGAIAPPTVVVNAVVDALSPLGVEHIDLPVTEEKVWRAIEAGRENDGQVDPIQTAELS